MSRRLFRNPAVRGLLFTLAAAIMLFCELMAPPVTGVADNGDFGKLLGRYGLGSGQDFSYAATKYFFGDQYRYHSGFHSSELLLIAPALAINRALSPHGSFDIRVMGAIHASLFLLAVFLLATALESAWIPALALLLYGDFMYAGYFHSFYMDTPAYLFTLWSAVFYERAVRRRRAGDSLALLLSMLLAVTSKPQYAMLGPWFALLFWTGRRILCAGRNGVAAAAAVALLAASWVSYRFLAPESYRADGPFTVIFSQIVPNSPDPDRALKELGLDASYRRWSGMNAFSRGTPFNDPAFGPQFLAHTSYRKIVSYYARHPAQAWSALHASLNETGRFVSEAGNFDSAAGQPPGAQYRSFQLASSLKRRLFYHHGDLLFCYFAGLSLAAAALLLWNRRHLPEGAVPGGVVLAALAMATLTVSSLADIYEQVRHQLVSLALFDMLLLVFLRLVAHSRRLRVPAPMAFLAAATVSFAIALYFRPAPPLPGELDHFDWSLTSFAFWNLVAVTLIWSLLRPRNGRSPARYVLPGAVCASLAGGFFFFFPTPVTAGQYDDADHRVSFLGDWTRGLQFPAAANRSLTYSETPGDGFRLVFRGSQVAWVHTKALNRGIAEVSVDGTPRGEVDLYSPTTVWQNQVVFTAPEGMHTFEVKILDKKNPRSSGRYVDVDALIVR